jgi:AcrR family transcriptional regulator
MPPWTYNRRKYSGWSRNYTEDGFRLSTSVSPTTPDRPQRADARRNRARVMDAARAAFAQAGADLPMEEIARRAGVGIGTVYRHFPNKEALLDALLADQLALFVERTRDALAKDDAWEAFRDMVREGASAQAEDMAFCELIMARKAFSRSEAVVALREELETETDKLLRRAKAEGRMREDFTIDDMPVLFASIAGAIRSTDGDAWKRQVEFALDGLRA